MMNIQEFCKKNPFLYHLTDRANFELILKSRKLLSTKLIAESSFDDIDTVRNFLRTKRDKHEVLNARGVEYKIRDQKPILMKVLERSLTDNWTAADFIEHLNARVFMWPTLDRLGRHYKRYTQENPIILRFKSADVLEINNDALFTNLNSGATRCHPYYDGNAPYRGPNTFLPAHKYTLGIRSVGEVTFEEECKLPKRIWVSGSPDGPWKQLMEY